jgi:hypothetical protein
MHLRLTITRSVARGSRRAWTLPEMMIAVVAGAMILASVGSVYVFMRKTLDATANYEELDRQSRNALDRMTRDIRQCGHLTNYDAQNLYFTNLDGSLLQYTWNTNDQTLTYTNAFTQEGGLLLTNCVSWLATEFIRIPSNGTTMTFFPLTTNDTPQSTKVVVLDWICRKTNYTTLTDSESVQTAKIVLRN